MRKITVSADPNRPADYCTLSEAVAVLPNDGEETEILLLPGTYHEKVEVRRGNLTIRGEDEKTCILTFADGAMDLMPEGDRRGTFRSYTLFVDADYVKLSHLTVRNDADPRKDCGQALALYADGDHFEADHCIFLSYQDTIFTAPLPPSAIQVDGFKGPKCYTPRRPQRQSYIDCLIAGDVDFIFGSAAAWFENCTIISVNRESPISLTEQVDLALAGRGSEVVQSAGETSRTEYGYVTAASTPEGQPFGYVFKDCRLLATVPDRSIYLGRPWRDYAKTVYIHCELGSHIRTEGFHDWDKPAAHAASFYAEADCYGPGAVGDRASFVHRLSAEEAKKYTKEAVLAPVDGMEGGF